MLKSLLIANRGEIACRVIRTARRLGIRTVAVHSEADRHAMHVREADEAVPIGPSPARESYLVGEKIIAAARETGADAIHPGYGFLSENADFAQAVIDAGLIWVGPKPESIRAMGLKDAAKKLMAEAGVPVTPGYLGEDQDPERLQREAEAVGFPVLIKAVAGGGGKGMRRVNEAAEFQEMLASCKREAAAAFGDDRVLIEKYVERPRHIEVQVFGDTHGNVVHLFERDCSLQRRHQKVIEEAPAPGMDEATRAAVCHAAVMAAKAVDYVGAGTVEFIADASEGLRGDRIWFMEMNTRLQVEHPVTEEVTGQDLVEWQLRVASGEALPCHQEQLAIEGHAVEARLYAEDPSNGFLPSVGRLESLRLCFVSGRDAKEVRVDTGVEQGGEISTHYDPMIAKLIVARPSREEAVAALTETLERVAVWPVRTNAAFVARALRHGEFREGAIDTGFIARHLEELTADPPLDQRLVGAAAAMLLGDYLPGGNRTPDSLPGPWESPTSFRLNAEPDRTMRIAVDGDPVDVGEAELHRPYVEIGGAIFAGEATYVGRGRVLITDRGRSALVTEYRPTGAAGGAAADGAILSPMPGRVIAVDVRQGDGVTKGQKLVTLEAMKMEHSLAAPFDGVVAELAVEQGAQVTEGTMLVRVEKGES